MSEILGAKSEALDNEISECQLLTDTITEMIQKITGGTVTKDGWDILISFQEQEIRISK